MPFSEFLWADFLRHRLDRKRVANAWETAPAEVLILAKSKDADYLPD
jgi:hypothetical protein